MRYLALIAALLLVAREIGDGVTVRLREKYGPVWTVGSVNVVALHEGVWYVTRAGAVYGAYPSSNYAVEVVGSRRDDEGVLDTQKGRQ